MFPFPLFTNDACSIKRLASPQANQSTSTALGAPAAKPGLLAQSEHPVLRESQHSYLQISRITGGRAGSNHRDPETVVQPEGD